MGLLFSFHPYPQLARSPERTKRKVHDIYIDRKLRLVHYWLAYVYDSLGNMYTYLEVGLFCIPTHQSVWSLGEIGPVIMG